MDAAELRQRASQKLGRDVSTKATATTHPAGPAKHGGPQQTLRMVLLGLYMNITVLLIFTTQLLGLPLYFYDQRQFYRWMAWTKEQFGLVLVFMSNLWCPITMRVYGDRSIPRDQIRKTTDGRLETRFSDRMVLIANHQIYTDWIYLWWTAYTSNLHGHFYIMLKRSLQFIPIVGQGMALFGFIFMNRKWASDEARIRHRLQKMNAKNSSGKTDPMWFLMFPEGTNLSSNGRKGSQKWAEKSGEKDMVHQVLPRSKGLFFCLRQLQATTKWVYDCTMAYEGVPPGEYGQDIFTLSSIYFEGRPPKSVSLHWRRFAVSSIPLEDENEFHNWLMDRWREKDALMDRYMKHGRFDAEDSGDIERFLQQYPAQYKDGYQFDFPAKDMDYAETTAKPAAPYEFVQIVVPPLALYTAVTLVKRSFRAVFG